MDRLAFLRAQPWFEEEDSTSSAAKAPALRTQESIFSSCEIYEGLASFHYVINAQEDLADRDEPGGKEDGAATAAGAPIAFKSSLLASSVETRIRLALRPVQQQQCAGSKRPRDDASNHNNNDSDGPSELLVRFESAGRALQGRLLHTHIISIMENVTSGEAAPGAREEEPPPFLSMRLRPTLDLRISPLPELSHAAGAQQLKRVMERLYASLPKQHSTQLVPAAASSSAPALVGSPSGKGKAKLPPADVGGGGASADAEASEEREKAAAAAAAASAACHARLLHWQSFLSGSSVLADVLDAMIDRRVSFPEDPTPSEAMQSRVPELLASLPVDLAQAMPKSRASMEEERRLAAAALHDAEAAYTDIATRRLQGLAPPPPPPPPPAPNGGRGLDSSAGGGSSEQDGEPDLPPQAPPAAATLESARQALRRAYAAKLSASLLPGRGGQLD